MTHFDYYFYPELSNLKITAIYSKSGYLRKDTCKDLRPRHTRNLQFQLRRDKLSSFYVLNVFNLKIQFHNFYFVDLFSIEFKILKPVNFCYLVPFCAV